MAYDAYQVNPDNTVTFTDSTGAPPVTASGPAAMARVQQIKAAKGGMSMGGPLMIQGDQSAHVAPGFSANANPKATMQFSTAPDASRADSAPLVVPGLSPAAPPPTAPAPPNPANAPFIQQLAQTAGIPQTDRTAKKPAGKPGDAAPVNPNQLVGAGGGQDDQIQTIVKPQAGGGVRLGPPQLAQTGMSTQEVIHDPQALMNQKRGAQNEYEAGQEQIAAEKTQAEQVAAAGRVAQQRQAQLDQQAAAAEQDRKMQMQRETSKLQELTAQVRSGEIDENRFWHNQDTSGRIAAAVAIGLGAYAGGRTGVNHAMDIYDKAVARDIDEQKTNMANKAKSLEDQKGLLSVMRQNFTDDRQAEAAAKAAYVDSAVRDVKQIMAENASPLTQAKGNAMLAQLQQRQALAEDEFNKHAEAKSYAMVQPKLGGGAAPGAIPYADVKKSETVKGPDGQLYEFGEGATAQKAAEQLGAINQNKQDADALAAITNNPANLADPSKRAVATAIVSRMVQRNTKAEGGTGTRFSKEAVDLAQNAMGGDPNALLNFGKSAGLAEYRNGLAAEGQGLIKQHAISKLHQFQIQDPKTGETTIRYQRAGKVGGPVDVGGEQVGE